MIGLWLLMMVWVAWAAQAGLGDWLVARRADGTGWLRVTPTSAALLGLSDRWRVQWARGAGKVWLRFAHERVVLGTQGRAGVVEVPLDAPCTIAPSTVVWRRRR